MKGSVITSMALCVLAALADARSGGLRPGQGRNLDTKTNYQEVYFSEMMAPDETVVILEDGPIKFTASCKTIDYDYNYYYSSSTFSSTPSSSMGNHSSMSSGMYSEGGYSSMTTRSSSAGHYYPFSSGGSSTECYNPCGSGSSGSQFPSGSYSFDFSDDDGYHMSDDSRMSDDFYSDYSYDYSYTESIAALELTYTATDADYLYGSPSYANYPNETVLVGGYEAGESRTQTVFAGRDGGYGDMSTLQSMSGYYVSINGDSTIGIHREWTEYLPGGMDSFPEGVECMMAGFITYVTPENA